MRVYIVFEQYYTDPIIEKIFKTREKAEKYAEEQNTKYHSTTGWVVWDEDVED